MRTNCLGNVGRAVFVRMCEVARLCTVKPGLSRAVAPLALLTTVTALVIALPVAAHAEEPPPTVRITEWMYNPVISAGEYIEITNLATTPVSLAGWSFDDDSRAPGTVPLDSLGTLAAGAVRDHHRVRGRDVPWRVGRRRGCQGPRGQHHQPRPR